MTYLSPVAPRTPPRTLREALLDSSSRVRCQSPSSIYAEAKDHLSSPRRERQVSGRNIKNTLRLTAMEPNHTGADNNNEYRVRLHPRPVQVVLGHPEGLKGRDKYRQATPEAEENNLFYPGRKVRSPALKSHSVSDAPEVTREHFSLDLTPKPLSLVKSLSTPDYGAKLVEERPPTREGGGDVRAHLERLSLEKGAGGRIGSSFPISLEAQSGLNSFKKPETVRSHSVGSTSVSVRPISIQDYEQDTLPISPASSPTGTEKDNQAGDKRGDRAVANSEPRTEAEGVGPGRRDYPNRRLPSQRVRLDDVRQPSKSPLTLQLDSPSDQPGTSISQHHSNGGRVPSWTADVTSVRTPVEISHRRGRSGLRLQGVRGTSLTPDRDPLLPDNQEEELPRASSFSSPSTSSLSLASLASKEPRSPSRGKREAWVQDKAENPTIARIRLMKNQRSNSLDSGSPAKQQKSQLKSSGSFGSVRSEERESISGGSDGGRHQFPLWKNKRLADSLCLSDGSALSNQVEPSTRAGLHMGERKDQEGDEPAVSALSGEGRDKKGSAGEWLTDKRQNSFFSSSAGDVECPQENNNRSLASALQLAATETCRSFRWKKGELIGQGTYGKVYKGLNEETGRLFAVKQIELSLCSQAQKQQIRTIQQEIKLMKVLDHDHIVRYLGSDSDDEFLYIFLEFVPGGSIASLLAQFGVFNEDLIRLYTRQILQGVEYLHSMGIVHRDIKGGNVLVNDHGVAKLADFGCSKQIQGVMTHSLEKSLCAIRGSIPWMAPEVIKQERHGTKADIWSVGATVLEMATATHPWPAFTNNVTALFKIATTKEPPPYPEKISEQMKSFLARCFEINPGARATAKELLQHPFLAHKD